MKNENNIKYIEKVRSGQVYLYKEDGYESMIFDVLLKDNIDFNCLEKALNKSLIRYPYLTNSIVKDGSNFFYVENKLPLNICNTEKFRSLGSKDVNFHLIDITYSNKTIYVAFNHGLCDGRGIMPFINTLIYYYCTFKNNKELKIDNINSFDSQMYQDEMVEPFLKNSINPNEITLNDNHTDGFLLPENNESVNKQKHYRYEIKMDNDSFIKAMKINNATPSILVSILTAKSIKNVNKNIDKPIIANVATDMRGAIGLNNTYKNCVSSVLLNYPIEFENLTLKEQAIILRESLKMQKDNKSLKGNAYKLSTMFDKIDLMETFEEKQKFFSFINNMILNTFILSYSGKMQLGECEQYVSSISMYGMGANGISLQMFSTKQYFTLNFQQHFKSDKYVKEYLKELDKLDIYYQVSEIKECNIPKDSISRK